MAAIGCEHTVLLRSDGAVVCCGRNDDGQCSIPPLEEGAIYTQVAAGFYHAVLLRSDGCAVACGLNDDGQCDVPKPDDCGCVQVAARGCHTVLLRGDGTAVACGLNDDGQCDLPAPGPSHVYSQAAAGSHHTVLLGSDGRAVACGLNAAGQCDLPELEAGATYTQVSAGFFHTVLLRGDGRAVACGLDDCGQCKIPELEPGASYVHIAAGSYHTVLLRSDGRAVACGTNGAGQCDIPPGDDRHASAGSFHTVLLRNEGGAVACGLDSSGQCAIPAVRPGLRYCASLVPAGRDLVLQLAVEGTEAAPSLVCRSLAGSIVASCAVDAADMASSVFARVSREVDRRGRRLRVVLPDGRLLHSGLSVSAFLGPSALALRPCCSDVAMAPHEASLACRSGRGSQDERYVPQHVRADLFWLDCCNSISKLVLIRIAVIHHQP